MICNRCGSRVPDESKYCMFCGNRVSKIQYYDENKTNSNNSLGSYYLDADFKGDGPKYKKTAGLLGVFLGAFGIHRFYLGYTGIGIAQIVVSLITCTLGGAIWGFIEGLCILCDTGITTDADGNDLV